MTDPVVVRHGILEGGTAYSFACDEKWSLDEQGSKFHVVDAGVLRVQRLDETMTITFLE